MATARSTAPLHSGQPIQRGVLGSKQGEGEGIPREDARRDGSLQSAGGASPASGLGDFSQRAEAVLRAAQEAFAKTESWVVAYRALMGRGGVVRQAFPDPEAYEWFTASSQCADLQEMIAAMRSQDTSKGNAVEVERMITIRVPESLHDALADEAEAASLSINKLCISKLIHPISSRFVPIQQGERRGRRPGPQGTRDRREKTEPQSS